MSPITVEVPEELAAQLRPVADHLPRILELGLRELQASASSGFVGSAEVLEFLAGLPSPEDIAALRPAEALRERVSQLLEKNRLTGLTPDEEDEWSQYEYLEHLVRIAKAKAHLKMQSA